MEAMKFEKLVDSFCEDCRLRGLTEETIRRYRSSLSLFLDFLTQKKVWISDVNNSLLKEFLGHIKFERKA